MARRAVVEASVTVTLSPVTRVQEIVREAHASRTPLRIVGGGSWMHGGRPVRASQRLETVDLAGVRAYVPGDLVITVGAGTTLREIAEATAAHGQWLPLDPPGDDRATIGAVIATGASGALALSAGRVRDMLLGVEVVDGTGATVRAGAPVVKNVAGFDLVRLAVGAFGTLGVVSEASLRLYARPAVDLSVSVSLGDLARCSTALDTLGLRALGFAALELLDAPTARACGVHAGDGWTLVARATGNARRVEALRAVLATVGEVRDEDPHIWDRLRLSDVDESVDTTLVVRISERPATVLSTIVRVENAFGAARARARIRATPHSGVVRASLSTSSGEAALVATALRTAGTTVIFERLSSEAWRTVPGAIVDTVSKRIRDAFDPARILNPGILGEEDVG